MRRNIIAHCFCWASLSPYCYELRKENQDVLHITLSACGKSKRDKSKLDMSPAMMLGNMNQLSFLCLLWALANWGWLTSLEAERQTTLKHILQQKTGHTKFSFVYRCTSQMLKRSCHQDRTSPWNSSSSDSNLQWCTDRLRSSQDSSSPQRSAICFEIGLKTPCSLPWLCCYKSTKKYLPKKM